MTKGGHSRQPEKKKKELKRHGPTTVHIIWRLRKKERSRLHDLEKRERRGEKEDEREASGARPEEGKMKLPRAQKQRGRTTPRRHVLFESRATKKKKEPPPLTPKKTKGQPNSLPGVSSKERKKKKNTQIY